MPDRNSLRVLVVDDEPLGCARLIGLLEQHPDVEIVGVAENGKAAVEAIRNKRPDLVFLDVQMPRMSGLDVVREVGPELMPPTIFATAGDQYAVDAFGLSAVDYLLKPYSDERFEAALAKGRRVIALTGLENLRSQLRVLLENSPATPDQKAPQRYTQRISVQMRGRLQVIPVESIDHIAANGVYAELFVGKQRYLLREPLQSLEDQLDPNDFFRIHRSEIVRLDRVELLLRGKGGEYKVQLKNGEVLPVGRSRREELERRLGRVS